MYEILMSNGVEVPRHMVVNRGEDSDYTDGEYHVLCFAAHLEHLIIIMQKRKEQTTTPISLGVVEFTQVQFDTFLQN